MDALREKGREEAAKGGRREGGREGGRNSAYVEAEGKQGEERESEGMEQSVVHGVLQQPVASIECA